LFAAIGTLRANYPYLRELILRQKEIEQHADEDWTSGESVQQILPLVVTELEYGRKAALGAPVTFRGDRGDTVIISGASGLGKTTLIMTLVGFIRPVRGLIGWGGCAMEELHPASLRGYFGYAGPEPYLIDADIRSNLLFGMASSHRTDVEIAEALRVACADFVFELDGGLGYRLREAGDGLSAGQKQRLAIARCVLRRPDVLLLDEATANIDEETENRIMVTLRKALPDVLIIAVSHRASMRRHATLALEI
jgi:ABC-type bacteriocin/lantibiotic exporter with double-glycine peptidase domain